MTVSLEELRAQLTDRVLPGGEIIIAPHESAICDDAVHAPRNPLGEAHPVWFIIASLRCMGITVDELCGLAEQRAGDVLLFGNCEVVQRRPLQVGVQYVATARIGAVDSKVTRDGSRLDTIDVEVRIGTKVERSEAGVVCSRYMFKRGAA